MWTHCAPLLKKQWTTISTYANRKDASLNSRSKGSFNVRMGSELHRRAALCAKAKGANLNQVVKEALEQYLAGSAPPSPSRSYWELMAAIRARQQVRGHKPPTREEVDAALHSERESWEQ